MKSDQQWSAKKWSGLQKMSPGRSRSRLGRSAAQTREQEGRSERPPCVVASGLRGRHRGRAPGCHHWRRRAQALHQVTSLGEAAVPLPLLRQAGRRRGRAHSPGRHRCRALGLAPRRRLGRSLRRRRRARALWRARHRRPESLRRWRGCGAGRHGAVRPSSPSSIRRRSPVRWRRLRWRRATQPPTQHSAWPLQPSTLPAFLGETPLGPARSTRCLLPATVGSNVVSPRYQWTLGSR